MRERLSSTLHYVRSLGAGRVLAGVLVTMLLGGPVLGLLAAADPGGVRTALADAISRKDSDDDEDAGLLTPVPGGAGGDDGPDTSLSPLSTETPAMTATQTATPSPSATVGPTVTGTIQPTMTATQTATPTPTPTLTVCPSSPSTPDSVPATVCSPDSPVSADSPDSPS